MLRSLRVAALCLAFTTLMLSSAGCQNKDGGKTGGGDKPRIAFVSNNSAAFWNFAEKGTEKGAKEADVVVTMKMPPNGTDEEQRRIIEDLMVKGVNGIAISVNDAKNSAQFLADVGKKVPLITVDNDMPNAAARRAYIGTHNYRAGRAAGELVAKAVPDGGKIVIFVGRMDAANPVERRQGVLDFLAGIDQKEIGALTPPDARDLKVGKYTLIDTRTDGVQEPECQRQCEDVLAKNPDVAAVVGLWAYNPPALLRAVENMKSKAAIIGFDEYPATLEGIKNGKIAGTIVQAPYEFGRESVKLLAAIARGDNDAVKKDGRADSENRIYIPHRVITKDNVGAFQAEVAKILGK